MRVSVVIPAYRAAGTIGRAVDSVLAQTHPAHEIIVVDDGSPDETASVVERTYGGRVVLVRKANGGASSARNAGIDRATGDFVAFLDADDYWVPEKLEKQLAVFERHPEVELVAGRYFEESIGGARHETARPFRPERMDRVLVGDGAAAFRMASLTWTGTVLVRREALCEKRFQSGLEPAEDRDMWVRILAGRPAYFLSEPLATAVHEPMSLSRSNLDRDCRNMMEVVERHRKLLGPRHTRIWQSYVWYRWAADNRRPGTALMRLMKSFWLWPMPYRGIDISARMCRVKRLAVLVAAATGIRRLKLEAGSAACPQGEI